MIRLIAIDMDGTLLSPDHTISPRNKNAILAAQKSGIEVIIATGRGYPEACDPVSTAELTLPFICLNGADVRDKEGHVISATHLVNEDMEQVQPILEANGIGYQLFIGDHVYTKSIEEQVELFVQLAEDANIIPPIDDIRSEVMKKVEEGYIREVSSYHDLIKHHGDKVYKVFGNSNNIHKLETTRKMLLELPGIAVSSSGSRNMEITNVNAQKGIALERYTKGKDIAMDHVMVIGDSFNDLSMMKRAGRSVAMSNAPAEVKAACSHETKTNQQDGVALAIEAIL